MIRILKITATALALAATPAAAFAQSSPFALGANIGSPGVGVEMQWKLTDSLVLRGGADWLSFSHAEAYSGIDYDGRLKSATASAFADWHPGATGFLVSGGAYFGERKIDLGGQPSAPVTVGGVSFTPAQVGRIDGSLKLSNVQPFAGLGWDNTFTGGGAWGFRGLVGVSLSKAPDVTLSASGGGLSNDATFLARLRQEEAEVRDDAQTWKYYPIVQVGVTRRF